VERGEERKLINATGKKDHKDESWWQRLEIRIKKLKNDDEKNCMHSRVVHYTDTSWKVATDEVMLVIFILFFIFVVMWDVTNGYMVTITNNTSLTQLIKRKN
jgi:hypothetical protein